MTAPRCTPRCAHVRNLDEVMCLTHGTISDPGRAWDAVDESAPIRLRHRSPRTGRAWTPAERDYLLRTKDRLSAKEIARRLGRTERGVHTYLSKLRLRKVRQLTKVRQAEERRWRWSEGEQTAIEDYARPGSLKALAGRIGRSYWAVTSQLYRLRLEAADCDGMVSARQVAREYGCSDRHVDRLIARGALPAQRSGRYWRIAPEDAEAARLALTTGGRRC